MTEMEKVSRETLNDKSDKKIHGEFVLRSSHREDGEKANLFRLRRTFSAPKMWMRR